MTGRDGETRILRNERKCARKERQKGCQSFFLTHVDPPHDAAVHCHVEEISFDQHDVGRMSVKPAYKSIDYRATVSIRCTKISSIDCKEPAKERVKGAPPRLSGNSIAVAIKTCCPFFRVSLRRTAGGQTGQTFYSTCQEVTRKPKHVFTISSCTATTTYSVLLVCHLDDDNE